ELALFAGDVKNRAPLKHDVDLVRRGMGVDALLLSGLQAIKIAEAMLRIEQWVFPHFLIRKTDEVGENTRFHGLHHEKFADRRAYCKGKTVTPGTNSSNSATT